MKIFKRFAVAKLAFATCLLLCNASPGTSQDILDMMSQDEADLEEVRNFANDYFEEVGTEGLWI